MTHPAGLCDACADKVRAALALLVALPPRPPRVDLPLSAAEQRKRDLLALRTPRGKACAAAHRKRSGMTTP